jgi:monoamine oxidase
VIHESAIFSWSGGKFGCRKHGSNRQAGDPCFEGRAASVIIVGGGLAGLSCAYELRRLGYEVVVLEGRGRAGGRVQMLREGLDPELSAEAGATRIPDTHKLTLSYVHEFGLTLETLS